MVHFKIVEFASSKKNNMKKHSWVSEAIKSSVSISAIHNQMGDLSQVLVHHKLHSSTKTGLWKDRLWKKNLAKLYSDWGEETCDIKCHTSKSSSTQRIYGNNCAKHGSPNHCSILLTTLEKNGCLLLPMSSSKPPTTDFLWLHRDQTQ